MRTPLLATLSLIVLLTGVSPAWSAIYSQNFDAYSTPSIGTRDPWGANSTAEEVWAGARRGTSGQGWLFHPSCTAASLRRAYDSATFGPVTDADSFELKFWIYNYERGNAGNVGYVALMDSATTDANIVGIIVGRWEVGATWIPEPAYTLIVKTPQGEHWLHPRDAYLDGGFQQWYQVILTYEKTMRNFTFGVYDAGGVLKRSDAFTLPADWHFTTNVFGGMDFPANDGRSIGVNVDDVTLLNLLNNVTGTVNVLDYHGPITGVGVTVKLSQGASVRTENMMLDANGQFLIQNVTPGTYSVAVKAYASLEKVITTTIAGPTNAGTFDLVGGDNDGNNAIDSTDLSIVLGNME
jgi:hypothetical protein